MPIYEYHCPDCDKDFEKLVSISASSEPQECPGCQSANTRRLLSMTARPTGSDPMGACGTPASSCGSGFS